MSKRFSHIAEVACKSEDTAQNILEQLQRMENLDTCTRQRKNVGSYSQSFPVDMSPLSNDASNGIGDALSQSPIVVTCKGQPRTRRLKSNVEKYHRRKMPTNRNINLLLQTQ